MDYPHVKGLARKRTAKGWRYILTINHKSITVPIIDGDSDVEFLKKVDQARKKLTEHREKNLDDWINEYITIKQLSQNTVKSYKNALRGFGLDDNQNRKALQLLLRSNIKQSTKRMKVTIIKTMFSWLILHGENVKNPAIDCTFKSVQKNRSRVMTPDELQLLHKYIDRAERREPMYALYILIMLNTGARSSTATMTEWADLDSENRLHLFNKKTKKPYDYAIPIIDEQLIRIWRSLENKSKMWGKRSNTRYIARLGVWMRYHFGRDKNGETLSPHSLRHTFATQALQAGVPLEVVSKLLDHQSPATTIKVYARFSDAQIDDAIKKTFG